MKVLIGHLIISVLLAGQVLGQKTKDVELIEFNQSACDKSSDPYRIQPRIISLKHLTDTLLIEIGFAATCCLEYIPKIKYSADTLYFSYLAKDEGDACFCICCYSFKHKIKGIDNTKFIVKLYDQTIKLSSEKYRTFSPTYSIVKGDTINRIDKYNQKQGLWISESNFKKYKDDRIIAWGHLYNDKKIQEEYDSKTDTYREYYPNGRLKLKCNGKAASDYTNCQQWDKNGKIEH